MSGVKTGRDWHDQMKQELGAPKPGAPGYWLSDQNGQDLSAM
jgi:hypothetical protein